MGLEVTFAGWAGTLGLIAALFLLDFFVSRPGTHTPSSSGRPSWPRTSTSVSAWPFGVVFGLIAAKLQSLTT